MALLRPLSKGYVERLGLRAIPRVLLRRRPPLMGNVVSTVSVCNVQLLLYTVLVAEIFCTCGEICHTRRRLMI